tara:strand:+ start:285 stop:1073 length:789 start_codon:yes stop_codon:yes gene_type:complete
MSPNSRQLVVVLLFCHALAGCAAKSPYTHLEPVPAGTEITIVGGPQFDPGAVYGNEQIARGALVGSVGGAVVGASSGATIGLACGPWAVFCVPTIAIFGAGVGLVTGAVMGGVHVGATSLPEEKAVALNTLLIERTQTGVYDAELRELLLTAATPHLKASLLQAGAQHASEAHGTAPTVRVWLSGLHFEQHLRDELTLQMEVSMQVHFGPAVLTKRYVFAHAGQRASVDYWLEDNGANLDRSVAEALQSNSPRMVRLLLEGL